MSSTVSHNQNFVVGGTRRGWKPMQGLPIFPGTYNNYNTYPETTHNTPKSRDCWSVFGLNPGLHTSETPTTPSDPPSINHLIADFDRANTKTYRSPVLADSAFNSPTSDGKTFEYPVSTPSAVWRNGTPPVASAVWRNGTAPRLHQGWSTDLITEVDATANESDSDDDSMPTHPNKYPVEIEYHENRFCSYQRQPTKSGERFQIRQVNSLHPSTLQPQIETQQNRMYQKHLVRICRCGKYQGMDGALQQGRANDCNGYEIHYSQKCRWKAYDDFKTGKRVLIRLCKCYKPIKN